ncbi:MAG: long-chain fatty acid--CoA ligase [Balneolales bacterium]|nr:long-chain fatty acid--CoA ligase [Balneolales bacterium]
MEIRQSTIPKIFRETVSKYGDRTAMRQKKLGVWKGMSWNQYHERALMVSSALIELGCKPGDSISILGDNCAEWLWIDMGAQYIGCISVGIYSTNSWQQCEYVIEHSESKVLFAENEEQIDKWLEFRENTPGLMKTIAWEYKGLREFQDPDFLMFDNFMELGRSTLEKNRKTIEEYADAVQPDNTAILVYTSGTTGRPKGAILTHGALSWMSGTIAVLDPEMEFNKHDEVMSFLPLCHIFERLFSFYLHIRVGYIVNFVESLETIPENLREIQPTIGYAVPRIWEKIHSGIMIRMADTTWLKRVLFEQGIKICKKAAGYTLDKKPVPLFLKITRKIVDLMVFRKLRERLGMKRMKVAFSGAAPISPEILSFYHAIGVTMLEGYGQTEGSGVSTFTTAKDFKLGTVGKVLPGADLRLSEDGEILIKSPGLFEGYYKNPEATSETLKNGWLHSGDIGELDEGGYLTIVDRKKDLIITAGGKNIAPQYIENKLKVSPYINDAVVIGDQRKFISALIVLDEDNVMKFAGDHKLQFSTYSDLTKNESIIELIDSEIKKVNNELARVEHVRKFTILTKRLYQEDGEVTPTMKVKRNKMNEMYQEEIEKMYQRD